MTIKLKRRSAGSPLVPGSAPLAIGAGGVQAGEPVYDAVADILYIGKGDDGAGNATAIAPIAGSGAYVKTAQMGAASGVASLDATGKLPAAQLPASIVGAMVYQGTWNASTNTPALASGTGGKGAFYKVSVAGSTAIDGNSVWNIGDIIAFDGTTWDKIDGPAEAVTSVAGRVGAITLSSADIANWATATSGFAASTSVVGLNNSLANVSSSLVNVASSLVNVTASQNALSTSFTAVSSSLANYAPLASPVLTGTPLAPTASAGNNTTQIATTAFLQSALAAYAPTGIDGGAI